MHRACDDRIIPATSRLPPYMPPPTPPRLASRLWNKWKSIRFFWRRQFLVGADLSGNTFWEFRDAIQKGRWRRIVKHTGGRQIHYADVKISRACRHEDRTFEAEC